ncbi:hypothetical protein H0H87_008371 [Tephrocybe sp. NHM501043]|nr:hypothetical protein H0H87_008371 [Tephrocybe sp. NHM501043]
MDRLENEHLGNMDQYRVTREVPLPYSFDEVHSENADDGDDDDDRTLQLDVATNKHRRRARKTVMAGQKTRKETSD